MSANTTIELNPEQRDILLTGLRFVRSSIALEMKDWTPEVESQRDRRYEELQNIEALLNGAEKAETTKV
jgi:hypothetical protein